MLTPSIISLIPLKNLLTAEEAALYMGVSRAQINELSRQVKDKDGNIAEPAQIGYYQPNRLRWFRKADLDAYMMQNRVTGKTEIMQAVSEMESKNKRRAA